MFVWVVSSCVSRGFSLKWGEHPSYLYFVLVYWLFRQDPRECIWCMLILCIFSISIFSIDIFTNSPRGPVSYLFDLWIFSAEMEWSRLLEEMNMVVSGSWDRTLRHWATTCFFSSRFPGVFVRWELQGFWRRFVLVLFFLTWYLCTLGSTQNKKQQQPPGSLPYISSSIFSSQLFLQYFNFDVLQLWYGNFGRLPWAMG